MRKCNRPKRDLAGTFLDIEAVFFILHDSEKRERQEIKMPIVRWISFPLQNMITHTSVGTNSKEALYRHSCGDNDGERRTHAYADDLIISVGSVVGDSGLTHLLQSTTERWCIKKGLSVNPDKTQLNDISAV